MARTMILSVLGLAIALATAPALAQQAPSRTACRLRVRSASPDAVITLDGLPVVPDRGVLVVAPGQHSVTAELPDGETWARIVDVAAGEQREVVLGPVVSSQPSELDLRLAPAHQEPGAPLVDRYPQRRVSRTWGWLGVGVSTALAAGLVYAALHTMELSTSYEQQPTRATLDEGLAYRSVTQYALLPATATSIGLTVLAFVLSAPAASGD